MLYRLLFDSSLCDQWFLGTPVNVEGDEWSFWRLLRGAYVTGRDLEEWHTNVEKTGRKLAFSFSGFDVPIVTREVGDCLASLIAHDIQLIPINLAGEAIGYKALVATQSVKCVDEARSEFTKWSPKDGRPDKTGEYRMFTKLRLDPSAVPEGVQVFRVAEWQCALVVTERVVSALKTCVAEGLIYEQVA